MYKKTKLNFNLSIIMINFFETHKLIAIIIYLL
jgi:hypothetical protein